MKSHAETNTGEFSGVRNLAFRCRSVVRVRRTALAAMLCMACLSAAQAVINDPVGYWDFEDAEGILANRVTPGPYHDATVLSGSPSFGVVPDAAGIVGNALVLDGASAIRLPYHQDNLGTDFTIAMWYWQVTNDTRMAVYQTVDNWDASYEALEDGSYTNFASYVGQSSAGSFKTGLKEWVHLVHAFSTVGGTTTLSVYTNGVLALTKSVNSNTVFSVLQIRAFHVGAHRDVGRFFNGMIDELTLWNRALSAAEAAALCQQGLDGLALEVSPGIWPRIDLEGTQWTYAFNVDEGLGGGVYQAGWLADSIQPPPNDFQIPDTAAGLLEDTAGNADGPFHAERLEPKFRVPMTTAFRQLTQGDFTIEARFKISELDRGILMGNFSGGVSALNLEIYSDNHVRLYLQPTTWADRVDLLVSTGAVNLRNGEWHHLAGIRKVNILYLYLDGQEVGQMADTIGAYELGGDYYYLKGDSRVDNTMFLGDMEDARLWTRALTTNEVASLAAGALPGGAEVAASGMLAEYAGLYAPYDVEYASPRYRMPLVKPLTQMTRTNFTVETWFRTTDPARAILIGSYANSSSLSCLNLELYTGNKVRFYIQPSLAGQSTFNLYSPVIPFNIYDGAWHHIAGVRRDGNNYLYVDGQQRAQAADTAGAFDLTAPYMYLGRDIRTGTTEFNGDLENARLWKRALTAAEVASLAAGELPGGAEVALDGLLTEHTYVLPTNALDTAGFQGSRFLRTYIAGTNTLSLVFEGLPRHTEIGLGALLAQLDTLEPVRDDDGFAILVDGIEILHVGLGFDGDEEVSSLRLFGESADVQLIKDTMTFGGENLFFCGSGTVDYNEHVYDLSQLEALQRIPHTGGTLTLELLGVQDQDGSNESFGIDQFELTVIPVKGTLMMLQ